MKKTFLMVSIMFTAMVLPAFAAKPNFMPAVYGDGEVWGTKGTTELPAPNDNNLQSFDGLYVIINSNNPMGQMPVSEAAPGNVYYNGGRWETITAWWTDLGLAAHGIVPVITSYAEFMVHYSLGHLDYEVGSPEGGPPDYFQCPLLPVKE